MTPAQVFYLSGAPLRREAGTTGGAPAAPRGDATDLMQLAAMPLH